MANLNLVLALLGASALNADTAAPFAALAERADETVTVTIDGPTLRALEPVFERAESDDAELFRILRNVKSIEVRNFAFHDRSQPPLVPEQTLANFAPAGWSRFLRAEENDKAQTVEGWSGPEGLALLVTEPGEVTFVRVNGLLPPEYAPALGKHFGLPSMERKKLSLPPDAIPTGKRPGGRHVEKMNFSRLVRSLENAGIRKQRIPMLWIASPAAFIGSGGAVRGTHVAIFEAAHGSFPDAVERSLPEGWTRLADVRERHSRTTVFLGDVGSHLHLLVATAEEGDDGVLVTTRVKASALDKEPTFWGNVGHRRGD
jgi:hypothetical protein